MLGISRLPQSKVLVGGSKTSQDNVLLVNQFVATNLFLIKAKPELDLSLDQLSLLLLTPHLSVLTAIIVAKLSSSPVQVQSSWN